MIHVVKHIKPFLQSGHFYLNPWALRFPTEGVSGYFYYNHVLQEFLYVLRRLIWVYTVCRYPFFWFLGINGLIIVLFLLQAKMSHHISAYRRFKDTIWI